MELKKILGLRCLVKRAPGLKYVKINNKQRFICLDTNNASTTFTTVIYVYTSFVTKRKESLIHTILISWFRSENNVILVLIDNQFAHNGCYTKYCYGSYINTHYWSLLIKFVYPQGPRKTHFRLVTFFSINIVNRM